jgi:hypothetical protein
MMSVSIFLSIIFCNYIIFICDYSVMIFLKLKIPVQDQDYVFDFFIMLSIKGGLRLSGIAGTHLYD